MPKRCVPWCFLAIVFAVALQHVGERIQNLLGQSTRAWNSESQSKTLFAICTAAVCHMYRRSMTVWRGNSSPIIRWNNTLILRRYIYNNNHVGFPYNYLKLFRYPQCVLAFYLQWHKHILCCHSRGIYTLEGIRYFWLVWWILQHWLRKFCSARHWACHLGESLNVKERIKGQISV